LSFPDEIQTGSTKIGSFQCHMKRGKKCGKRNAKISVSRIYNYLYTEQCPKVKFLL